MANLVKGAHLWHPESGQTVEVIEHEGDGMYVVKPVGSDEALSVDGDELQDLNAEAPRRSQRRPGPTIASRAPTTQEPAQWAREAVRFPPSVILSAGQISEIAGLTEGRLRVWEERIAGSSVVIAEEADKDRFSAQRWIVGETNAMPIGTEPAPAEDPEAPEPAEEGPA